MARLGNSVLRSRAVRAVAAALEDRLPPLRAWHRFEYEQHFFGQSTKARMFFGIYDSVQQAVSAIPKNSLRGHDHPELADRHTSDIGRIWPSDYAVLFWLRSLLQRRWQVFDLGGSVGLSFYGFAKYLQFPKDLTWKVCEVPAVACCGTKLAALRNATGLSFTSRIEDMDGVDILLASSSLQFLEAPLWQWLSQLISPPSHLLINRTPLCEGK